MGTRTPGEGDPLQLLPPPSLPRPGAVTCPYLAAQGGLPEGAESELSGRGPAIVGKIQTLEAGWEFTTPIHPLTNWNGYSTSLVKEVVL